VCSEKAYCNICMHCEKKTCPDCKSAHMDILRREINRINNQIRRGLHRLVDILAVVEKNTANLQNNSQSVAEEIDEIYRRLTKAVKERTDYLRNEMDKYMTTEMKNLSILKENLELEISNITSNCDLADKYMNDGVEWEDCELMDTKEIFLKTVEFIRNFETESSDYSRRMRFSMACDPNQLVNNLCTYGDLHFIHPPTTTQSAALLQPSVSGIMRSKSDHRLATQFRQQQDTYNADDEPLLGGRKFGERPKPSQEKHDSRHGYDYNEDHFESPSSRSSNKNRFRSRFVRGHHEEEDENETGKVKPEKEKEKLMSTEDVAKGPLSGIFRILDSPRAMKRIQDIDKGPREKKEPAKPAVPTPVAQAKVPPAATTPARRPPAAARQQSEDEIEKIKQQNKTAGSSNTASVTSAASETDRPSILKKVTPATVDESEVKRERDLN
jgi:tripartite motif-containing protein 71